jgi:hypothetical protein
MTKETAAEPAQYKMICDKTKKEINQWADDVALTDLNAIHPECDKN